MQIQNQEAVANNFSLLAFLHLSVEKKYVLNSAQT